MTRTGARLSLAAAVVVLVSGCGFAPQEQFGGRRAGDGIAPWTDLGPVQMCFGNEFVGPPESQPGGFCLSINSVPAPCTADDDCRSRETCVCGQCTVQYCTVNSDCTEDRICFFGQNRCSTACATNEDCDGGECVGGVCQGRCFTNEDCQTGEVCNSDNFCVADACSADDECLGGERCRIQRTPRVATEPTVLAASAPGEPRYTMWLELSDEFLRDQRAIWRATSEDGRHYRFDPARPVLEDGGDARAPSVIRGPDGSYAMYYQLGDGTALKFARSEDGTSFGGGTAVLASSGGSQVRAPSAVLLSDGTVAVYYQIGDGAAVGLARGELGGSLRMDGAPITPGIIEDPASAAAESQFWVDIANVKSPHVLLTPTPDGQGSLRIWFSAFGKESGDSFQFGEIVPIDPGYSLGYASSDPMDPSSVELWPFNPIFDRVTAFLDHHGELSPAAVQISDGSGQPTDGYLLYYIDADADSATDPVVLGRMRVLGNGNFK